METGGTVHGICCTLCVQKHSMARVGSSGLRAKVRVVHELVELSICRKFWSGNGSGIMTCELAFVHVCVLITP